MSALAPSFLIIQTAFIGDVILATALVEKIRQHYPQAPVDFLVRKGNESLLTNHPYLREVIIWDKKKRKIPNLIRILRNVQQRKYTYVVNVHRFASSGFIAAFSGARTTIGFDKNPLSFLFTIRKSHIIKAGIHEVDRNQSLIAHLTDNQPALPRLYPSSEDEKSVASYVAAAPYICLAPTSVWFTKQFPAEKWAELLKHPSLQAFTVYVLGGPADRAACDQLIKVSQHPNIINLAGTLNYLASAALMSRSSMNYVNDSAPMHMASSMNAPVVAVYCSTIPAFGFGPLSTRRYVVETADELYCRPCGVHGYKKCPEGHFKCALTIAAQQLVKPLLS